MNQNKQTDDVLSGISDGELISAFETTRLNNIYDIAYAYGVLEIESIYQEYKDSIPFPKSDIIYFSPTHAKAKEHFGEAATELSLVLSYNRKEEKFEFKSVYQDSLSPEKTLKHGYSRPANKTSGTPHSIAQLTSTSGYDVSDMAEKLVGRLDDWVTDSFSDYESTIANALYNTVESENLHEEIGKIQERVDECLEGESKFNGLFSIEFYIDGKTNYITDFEFGRNEIKENKINRFKSLSSSSDSSGEGICTITGKKEDTILGLVPGSPLNYMGAKQQGFFDNLDSDTSNQTRGFSPRVAMYVQHGSWVIEELYNSITQDERLVYLPYYRKLNPENARNIWEKVESARKIDDNDDKTVTHDISEWVSDIDDESLTGEQAEEVLFGSQDISNNNYGRLLYSCLFTYEQQTMYFVLEENTGVSEAQLQKFSSAYRDSVKSSKSAFPDSIYKRYNEIEGEGSVENLLNGKIIRDSLIYLDKSSGQSEQRDATTEVFNHLFSVLRGGMLEYNTLVKRFSDKIEKESREQLGGRRDTFPTGVVVEQNIFLLTLLNWGKVRGESIKNSEYINTGRMESNLETYIQNHPLLANNDERTAAFVLGGLVGRIGAYQNKNGLSRTIFSSQTVDSVTRNKIPRIVGEVIDKVMTYSESDNMGLQYKEYTQLLSDYMARIENWECTNDDLRFAYSLGIAYGYHDVTEESDEKETEEVIEGEK
jgi:CRISPR-associated protein Cas8b/Csh1 subtype I-B